MLNVQSPKVAQLPLPCPQCNYKQVEFTTRLRADPNVTCNGCGITFEVTETQLQEFMRMRAHLGMP